MSGKKSKNLSKKTKNLSKKSKNLSKKTKNLSKKSGNLSKIINTKLGQLLIEIDCKSAKSFILNLAINRKITPTIPELANAELMNELYQIKKEKNKKYPERIWFRARNYTNDYELVSSSKRKFDGQFLSAPSIVVVSRAYFKTWEIFHYFKDINFVSLKNDFIYVGLAEGPGGMAQSVLDFRRRFAKKYSKNDNYFAITLKEGPQESTKWGEQFPQLDKVKINYGSEKYGGANDGNLLNPNNIRAFRKFVGKKADLITADGGVLVDDEDSEFEVYKEQIHLALFYNEIVAAMCLQKKGGSFVLKIYDIFTLPTVQLIFLLKIYYEKVWIFKPVTSRPANSEKYLVCANFLGVSENCIEQLLNLSEKMWNSDAKIPSSPSGIFIQSFANVDIPKNIYISIAKFNDAYVENQLESIKKGMTVAKMMVNNRKLFNIRRRKMIDKLIKYAVKWCKKNNIPIQEKYSKL